jgi:hypothetical protein
MNVIGGATGLRFKEEKALEEFDELFHLMNETARKLEEAGGRGLHSSTSQLNQSAFDGIGGARRGCVARVKVVSGVVRV